MRDDTLQSICFLLKVRAYNTNRSRFCIAMPYAVEIEIAFYILLIVIIVYYSIRERSLLSEEDVQNAGEIMMEFHIDPDYEDFIYIWKIRDRLPKIRIVNYWLYGVQKAQPQFITYAEFKGYCVNMRARDVRDVERGLRRVLIKPTAELLDCVWAVYFATGDVTYSNIIRDIANNPDSALHIKASASWSYKSITGVRAETVIN